MIFLRVDRNRPRRRPRLRQPTTQASHTPVPPVTLTPRQQLHQLNTLRSLARIALSLKNIILAGKDDYIDKRHRNHGFFLYGIYHGSTGLKRARHLAQLLEQLDPNEPTHQFLILACAIAICRPKQNFLDSFGPGLAGCFAFQLIEGDYIFETIADGILLNTDTLVSTFFNSPELNYIKQSDKSCHCYIEAFDVWHLDTSKGAFTLLDIIKEDLLPQSTHDAFKELVQSLRTTLFNPNKLDHYLSFSTAATLTP